MPRTTGASTACRGGAGNDTLRGGGSGGPDHLDGGIGDDHLLALTHGGEMVGGPGSDTFEYSGNEFSGGEIEDFTKGDDMIRFAFSDADVSVADLNNMLRNSSANVLDLCAGRSWKRPSGLQVRRAPGPVARA